MAFDCVFFGELGPEEDATMSSKAAGTANTLQQVTDMINHYHEALWHHYEHTAMFARQLGSQARALRILREALRDCEEFGELPEGVISQAHSMADTYLEEHRFADAESVYRLVLEVREKLLGQTHPDVVDSLKRVAFVQIMSFRAETLGPNSVDTSDDWTDTMSAAS